MANDHEAAETRARPATDEGFVFPGWVLGVIVVAGLAMRIWVLNSILGPIDSDEAVGGLIARHFVDGEVAVFLWGNAYGGTLEAILAAPVFAVVGSSAVVIKMVMVLAFGVGCLLTWRIGRRIFDPAAAVVAAAYLWIAPAALVVISTKARMYYGAALVLSLGIVLCCLRLAEARSKRDMAVLGLLVGLGLWTAPFVFYVAIPAVVWLLLTRPRRWLDVPLAVPGALLGALPWIAWNARNDWASLHEKAPPLVSSYAGRLRGFFSHLLPGILGLRGSYSREWLLGPVGKALYLAVLAGFVVFVIRCVANRRAAAGPAVAVAIGFPFLFAVPKASSYVYEPRYGLLLAPFVALLVGAAISSVLRSWTTRAAALALAGVMTVAGLGLLTDWARAHPGNHDLNPSRMAPLIAEFRRNGVSTAYADYWISYALSFESKERIVATPVDFVRYAPFHRKVRGAGTTTYAFYRDTAADTAFQAKLTEQGAAFERLAVADFAVYYVDPPLP